MSLSFLDDLPRITREDYVPNFSMYRPLATWFLFQRRLTCCVKDDILRARVRTVGPQEHQIHLEKGQ